MPLYEYKCNKCQIIFEILIRSLKDNDKEIKCPECDSKDVSKLISKGIQIAWNCGGFHEGYTTNGEQR